MKDFGKYCKNRIKYSFYKFIFIILIGLIIMILNSKFDLFASKVYALENKTIYGATSGDWYNQTLSQSGKFVYNANTNGGQTVGNVGTTYSDANFGMYFGFYHTVTAGKIYNVKINFNDYDVRHTIDYSYIHINGSACTVQAFQLETTNNSGNAKTISVSFSCPNPSNAVWFSIYKESDGYYYVTTINWRFNSVQIEEATDGTDNIINNNNMNTQNIINNNNANTQEIIDNQNQNTQDLIDSQKVCEYIDKNSILLDNKYLISNGVLNSDTLFGVTDYISIHDNAKLTRISNGYNINVASLCFYNTNKTLISCIANANVTGDITIPTNTNYVRFSINKEQNQPQYKICKDGNQATSDDNKEAEKTRKGILAGILDLPSKIGEMLTSLFVPTQAQLEPIFEDLKQWFELKFGILGQLLITTIDFVERFYDLSDDDVIIEIPEITIPNFENETPIIQQQSFNWTDLLESKQSLNNLWTLYLDFMDVIIIIAFLGLCENILSDILGERQYSGDTIYESEGESYDVNDETGEMTNHKYWTKRSKRK